MNRLPHGVVAGALVLAVACAGAGLVDLPPGEPYASGTIDSITHHATASRYLVRAGPGSAEPCGISATADTRTRYLARSGSGPLRELPRSELRVGDTVEVYVEGPVAESCPPQGGASAIVRISGVRG